jgi:hypothetical protein
MTLSLRLKRIMLAAAQRAPAVFNPLWRLYFPWRARRWAAQRGRGGPRGVAFREIYRVNSWGSDESRSGPGSTLTYTAPLRRRLPHLLSRLGVRTLLDAPCGDFHWLSRVPLGGITYIGGDIVPELIDEVRARHSAPGRSFRIMDIVEQPPPSADLWLCRDALFHLPNADVAKVLQNFARSDIEYFLSSNYEFSQENIDITPGGFRYLNLRKAPFCLPAPVAVLEDFVVPFPPRVLALWSRKQIASSVAV